MSRIPPVFSYYFITHQRKEKETMIVESGFFVYTQMEGNGSFDRQWITAENKRRKGIPYEKQDFFR